MSLFYFSIGLTILSNVLYHIFQKLTPGDVNPMATLAVTYAVATVICLTLIPLSGIGFLDSLRELNWATFGLAFAIVGLEVGFLLAYRAGWDISLGVLVSNVAVGMILVPIGLLFFKEGLSPRRVIGIIVCMIGLILVNQR